VSVTGKKQSMGLSSAYPKQFGEAVRAAHALQIKYGEENQAEAVMDCVAHAVRMAASLPPAGKMDLPDALLTTGENWLDGAGSA
jgi:hypothetical protein